MTILDGVVLLFGSAIAGLNTASQLSIWQRKEYRWDRMRSHLLSSEFSPTLFR
jgi:hypothetical protein